MYFSHLGVFLISVKPMTTENTENKTTPKICKITVPLVLPSLGKEMAVVWMAIMMWVTEAEGWC